MPLDSNDLEQIRGIVAAAKSETSAEIAAAKSETSAEIAAAKSETSAEIAAAKGETVEAMRDMQTEVLRGLERFSRGNFAHLHRLEASDSDIWKALTALEERVMALETRPPR
jgi:hypothetical protein